MLSKKFLGPPKPDKHFVPGTNDGDILQFHQFLRAADGLMTRIEAQECDRSCHPAIRSEWRAPIDAL